MHTHLFLKKVQKKKDKEKEGRERDRERERARTSTQTYFFSELFQCPMMHNPWNFPENVKTRIHSHRLWPHPWTELCCVCVFGCLEGLTIFRTSEADLDLRNSELHGSFVSPITENIFFSSMLNVSVLFSFNFSTSSQWKSTMFRRSQRKRKAENIHLLLHN